MKEISLLKKMPCGLKSVEEIGGKAQTLGKNKEKVKCIIDGYIHLTKKELKCF